MFSHPDYDGHERVVYARDAASGLSALVALHSTALGPGFGGCRMWPYPSDAAALTDVLRLSRGMTYKSAICNLPYGGGKSVIVGDPATMKTPDLLRAMGRLVESMAGSYIIADDVGTTLDDLAVMRRETGHTAAATTSAQQPLAVTAWGVFNALKAVARVTFGREDPAGLVVGVQGLGNVGYPLCDYLHRHGAQLVVADRDPVRVARAIEAFGARAVAPDDIYDQPVDIFAPCALGGVLNDQTIPRLRANVVCGGANNQLAMPLHDAVLAKRRIIFVPDYLVSAGGVIDFHQENLDDRPEAILAAVEIILGLTEDILKRALEKHCTPLMIADEIVRQRIAAGSTRG